VITVIIASTIVSPISTPMSVSRTTTVTTRCGGSKVTLAATSAGCGGLL